ncbi:hypothetical protein [Pseudomonas syringae]|uniref:hypothetical protein n=1 Tax=Pseudomonas syringae TaxID=317 RepID=UPI001BCB4795|nr:hypothetical protein [Pseudomonas syringae]MBS7463042.1 hypothetical protein [Pseudomonas syringae]
MHHSSPCQRRSSICREEERVWVSFYQRVGRDPSLAAELLALMKADAVMHRELLALYLCCRESIRCHEARRWRDQQLANIMRRPGENRRGAGAAIQPGRTLAHRRAAALD